MSKIILVTGAHRSGSTWTGKIIDESNRVRYIQEPFNITIKKYNSPFQFWFEYISLTTDASRRNKAKKYLNKFISNSLSSYFKGLMQTRSLRTAIYVTKNSWRRSTQKPLLKDPIALFSAEWIYNNFDADVIVNIRHPAAFIASLMVKNWEFDFSHFKNQPELVDTYLNKYKDQIEAFSKNKPDIIRQGILLWNCLYSVVLAYKMKYSNKWYFVKHEDLSLNPIDEFNEIFDYLNLPFDDNIQKKIIETTTSSTNSESHRDSKNNIMAWKKRLNNEEIELIKEGTDPLWKNFYSSRDW